MTELSVHWQKFFACAIELDALPVSKWKSAHLVLHFARKYYAYYGIEYTFAFNGSPSQSSEVKLLGRLSNMLTKDPVILKDYIDWYFETEIVKRKRKINSIAAIAQIKSINDYKFNRLLSIKKSNIDRSTLLPPNYIDIISKYGLEIKDYGGLAFLKRMNEKRYDTVFDALKVEGLDISTLENVK